MKIIVDKEGSQVMRQLCDIVLKATGLQNLGGVVNILNSIEVDSDSSAPQVEEDKKAEDEAAK